jgi:hypothetical protein
MKKESTHYAPIKEYGGLEIIVISKSPLVAALFCLAHDNTAA